MPLLVVDAHFVNVLLFDAEKSVDIVSFVQVLQDALSDAGFPKVKELTKTWGTKSQ